jgi:arginine-tRNA-protein transferase
VPIQWLERSYNIRILFDKRRPKMSEPLDQFRVIERATPAEMDALWAAGWRHFGTQFFRYARTWYGEQQVRVLLLRIDLRKFSPSRSQRRVLKRNADVRVEFGPATIDAERETMFDSHRLRFKENRPESLRDFLSSAPSQVPCAAKECRLVLNDRLFAIGYFDVGHEAVSAVYSMFDPAECRRSPGIKLILEEVHWATEHEFRYFYLGYCYDQQSFYDYKKRFAGSEYLDWQTMRYLAFSEGVEN